MDVHDDIVTDVVVSFLLHPTGGIMLLTCRSRLAEGDLKFTIVLKELQFELV